MPIDFVKCVADGGKVVTKTFGGGKYMHMCKDKSGKWHSGEMKMAKIMENSNKKQ